MMLSKNENAKITPIAIIKELSDEERERLIIEEKEKIERDEKSKWVYAFEKGYKKGKESVLKNGFDITTVGIVSRMLKKGYDIHLISEVTELTTDQVKILKNQIQEIQD